ncbi:MAG: hypothetical protein ACE5J2_09310 [Nitrososphaerales archaeon]
MAEPSEEVVIVVERQLPSAAIKQEEHYWEEVTFYLGYNVRPLLLSSIPYAGAFISHSIIFSTGEGMQGAIAPKALLCMEMDEPRECNLLLTMFLLRNPHTWLEFGAASIVAAASLMFIRIGRNSSLLAPWKWSSGDKKMAKHELKYLAFMVLIGVFLLFLGGMTEAGIT